MCRETMSKALFASYIMHRLLICPPGSRCIVTGAVTSCAKGLLEVCSRDNRKEQRYSTVVSLSDKSDII